MKQHALREVQDLSSLSLRQSETTTTMLNQQMLQSSPQRKAVLPIVTTTITAEAANEPLLLPAYRVIKHVNSPQPSQEKTHHTTEMNTNLLPLDAKSQKFKEQLLDQSFVAATTPDLLDTNKIVIGSKQRGAANHNFGETSQHLLLNDSPDTQTQLHNNTLYKKDMLLTTQKSVGQLSMDQTTGSQNLRKNPRKSSKKSKKQGFIQAAGTTQQQQMTDGTTNNLFVAKFIGQTTCSSRERLEREQQIFNQTIQNLKSSQEQRQKLQQVATNHIHHHQYHHSPTHLHGSTGKIYEQIIGVQSSSVAQHDQMGHIMMHDNMQQNSNIQMIGQGINIKSPTAITQSLLGQRFAEQHQQQRKSALALNQDLKGNSETKQREQVQQQQLRKNTNNVLQGFSDSKIALIKQRRQIDNGPPNPKFSELERPPSPGAFNVLPSRHPLKQNMKRNFRMVKKNKTQVNEVNLQLNRSPPTLGQSSSKALLELAKRADKSSRVLSPNSHQYHQPEVQWVATNSNSLDAKETLGLAAHGKHQDQQSSINLQKKPSKVKLISNFQRSSPRISRSPQHQSYNSTVITTAKGSKFPKNGKNFSQHSPQRHHTNFMNYQSPILLQANAFLTGALAIDRLVSNVKASSPTHEVVQRHNLKGTRNKQSIGKNIERQTRNRATNKQTQNQMYPNGQNKPVGFDEEKKLIVGQQDLEGSSVAAMAGGGAAHTSRNYMPGKSNLPTIRRTHLEDDSQTVQSVSNANINQKPKRKTVVNKNQMISDEQNNFTLELHLEENESSQRDPSRMFQTQNLHPALQEQDFQYATTGANQPMMEKSEYQKSVAQYDDFSAQKRMSIDSVNLPINQRNLQIENQDSSLVVQQEQTQHTLDLTRQRKPVKPIPITGTLGNSNQNRNRKFNDRDFAGNKMLPNLGFRSSSLKPVKMQSKKRFYENKRNSQNLPLLTIKDNHNMSIIQLDPQQAKQILINQNLQQQKINSLEVSQRHWRHNLNQADQSQQSPQKQTINQESGSVLKKENIDKQFNEEKVGEASVDRQQTKEAVYMNLAGREVYNAELQSASVKDLLIPERSDSKNTVEREKQYQKDLGFVGTPDTRLSKHPALQHEKSNPTSQSPSPVHSGTFVSLKVKTRTNFNVTVDKEQDHQGGNEILINQQFKGKNMMTVTNNLSGGKKTKKLRQSNAKMYEKKQLHSNQVSGQNQPLSQHPNSNPTSQQAKSREASSYKYQIQLPVMPTFTLIPHSFRSGSMPGGHQGPHQIQMKMTKPEPLISIRPQGGQQPNKDQSPSNETNVSVNRSKALKVVPLDPFSQSNSNEALNQTVQSQGMIKKSIQKQTSQKNFNPHISPISGSNQNFRMQLQQSKNQILQEEMMNQTSSFREEMQSLHKKEVLENPKNFRSKRKQRSKAAHYDSLQIDTSQGNNSKPTVANKKKNVKKGDREDSENSRQMTRAEKKAEKVEARRQIKVLNQIEVSPWQDNDIQPIHRGNANNPKISLKNNPNAIPTHDMSSPIIKAALKAEDSDVTDLKDSQDAAYDLDQENLIDSVINESHLRETEKKVDNQGENSDQNIDSIQGNSSMILKPRGIDAYAHRLSPQKSSNSLQTRDMQQTMLKEKQQSVSPEKKKTKLTGQKLKTQLEKANTIQLSNKISHQSILNNQMTITENLKVSTSPTLKASIASQESKQKSPQRS